MRRRRQPFAQGDQHVLHGLRSPAVLQPEQGGYQVTHPGQFGVGIGGFGDEQIAQAGSVGVQPRRTGFDQVGQVRGRSPAPATIVQDNGEHWRQAARTPPAPKLPAPDQVLVEQIEVGGQPGRHEGMNAGLEFKQDVDVQPVRSPA